jgi:hypothetical protein
LEEKNDMRLFSIWLWLLNGLFGDDEPSTGDLSNSTTDTGSYIDPDGRRGN